MSKTNVNIRKLYAQAINPKVLDVIKLKENYPNLLAYKIKNIHKIINDTNKSKSHIKMITKGPSHKQVIIPISKTNINKIMVPLSVHISNINRVLRNIKSKVMVDYIQLETTRVTIVTNSMTLLSNLQIIKNYVKNIKNITSEDI